MVVIMRFKSSAEICPVPLASKTWKAAFTSSLLSHESLQYSEEEILTLTAP